MSKAKYAAYEALGPFFEIVIKGLNGLVDGDHYFDAIADDATFEFLYEFHGWPRIIRGRAELMTAYSGYGNSIRLRSAEKLVVYQSSSIGHSWESPIIFIVNSQCWTTTGSPLGQES